MKDFEIFEMIKAIDKIIRSGCPSIPERTDEQIWEMVEKHKKLKANMESDEKQHMDNHIEFAKTIKKK